MEREHSSVLGWLDASAGLSGDMLLGALVDAGASLEAMQACVDAVIPGAVLFTVHTVHRAGQRATKVDVSLLQEDQTQRRWRDIRRLLESAALPDPVRRRALRVFSRLAEAEGRVHGVQTEDVHFHEVGSWDSIADVIGVATGLHHLGVVALSVSPIALGSGHIQTAHGQMPVPVPAVLEMSRGWQVTAGGDGELTTPTGMAIAVALAERSEAMPALEVSSIGVGAGTRDSDERANVVRFVMGYSGAEASRRFYSSPMTLLEANVDDLDPRVWPSVLSALIDGGAADAWLVAIVMKKGRPAHTLKVLVAAAELPTLRWLVFQLTSTIGIRESEVRRTALDRLWVGVPVTGGEVRVKVAHFGGEIIHATPEFDDVAAVAAHRGVAVRQVLEEASAAAVAAGLVPGAPLGQGER